MSLIVQKRFEDALMATGMLNRQFLDMIRDGEVDNKYIREAFKNFQKSLNPEPYEVRTSYVLGFLFDENFERVLLIRKNRPSWQAGKLNGIGGKIEQGETALQAMEREFLEETSFVGYKAPGSEEVHKIQWNFVGIREREAMSYKQEFSYRMYLFAGTIPNTRLAEYDVQKNKSSKDKSSPPKFESVFEVQPEVLNPEQVLSLPLNFEVLSRAGVPGLEWAVGLAKTSLKENVIAKVYDAPILEDDNSL